MTRSLSVSSVRPALGGAKGTLTVLLLGVGALVAGLAAYAVPSPPAVDVRLPIFVLAAAVGEAITLDSGRARPVPVSAAVVAALALLGHPPHVVAGVAAAGWLAWQAVERIRPAGSPGSNDLAGGIASGWALPGVVAVATTVSDVAIGDGGEVGALAMAGVAAALVLGLPLWEAARTAAVEGGATLPRYRGVLGTTAWAGVALAAGAGLAALAHPVLGEWGLALMLLPLLAARSGLRRLAAVRVTYDQTVRAMSQLPEVIAAVPRGHGIRVAETVVGMGRELGLPESDVAALERAALLHEIGQVNAGGDEREVATASAAVAAEVRNLQDVSVIIARHREEVGLGPALGEPRVPVAARILRTACEYDLLTAPTDLDPRSWEGVRHFHLSAGHRHEPAMIQALARTVDRSFVF